MEHTKSTFSIFDEDHTLENGARSTLKEDPGSSLSDNLANIRNQTSETLANKVNALEEKLEKEAKNFGNLEVCLTAINQRFSSMEGMMKQLLELHTRSAPVAETGLAVKDTDVDSKLQNLKIPIFEGEDVHEWVYCAEKYFDANGVTEDEKMVEATRCLEGRALAWYQQQENRQPFRSWEEFVARLLGHFRDTQDGDLYDQFFALTQEGTFGEYQERFQLLSSGLVGLSEATLEENFMKGLKAEIRAVLLQMKLQNLDEMIGLAQVIEDTIRENQCKTGTSSVSSTNEEQSASNLKQVMKSEARDKQANSKRRPRGKKKLAPEPSPVGVARLSLLVVQGDTSDSILMYRGEIAKHGVAVVIGTGTTHNFISNQIVDKLGIKVTTKERFDVDVVMGAIGRSRGVCKSVKLDIQGVKICQDFIPYDLLEHVDMVLGMAWLQTIEKWRLYGSPLVIDLFVGNRWVKLHRDPRLSYVKW